ncbi:oxygenase MpaB family protein [Spirosoma harenae]
MPTLIKSTRPFSDELLEGHRQQGDAPADAVIASVVEGGGSIGLRSLMKWLTDTSDFAVSEQHPSVQEFFTEYAHLPSWADTEKMQRGMRFFQKNAQQIGFVLGFFSLPYSYLGAHGAQVLWLTERIKNDTLRRLRETGEWILAVNNPKEWLPDSTHAQVGKATIRTLKVRLIHAGARWFSLHSGRWNMAWGLPVNQEDMAGTNLAFSYIVLLGLRKAASRWSVRSADDEDEENYLHHINVVGWLNGVADELLPRNLREAYTLHQAIIRRQFAPSEAGIGLTHALLNALADPALQQIQPANPAGGIFAGYENRRNLAAAEMRFFLGDTYANWLGIPDVAVEKRLVSLMNQWTPFFSKS